MRRDTVRWLLCVPPALLSLAGALLLIATPQAWGAADHVKEPSWTPVAGGLMFTVAALGTGAWVFLDVIRRTRGDYGVVVLQVLFTGCFVILFAIGAALIATRIGEPSSYDTLLDDQSQQPMAPEAFLAFTAFGALFFGGVCAGLAYAYAHAIDPGLRGQVDRSGEVDGVGELLRGRGAHNR